LRESKDTVAKLSKELSAELGDLSKRQFAALEKAIFLGMTIEERVEYDNRHARIVEILQGGWALATWFEILRARGDPSENFRILDSLVLLQRGKHRQAEAERAA
jgi:hypothetical protein